ncbi:hypothetical protein BHE74_00022483, partial [Ensete ventricosum]
TKGDIASFFSPRWKTFRLPVSEESPVGDRSRGGIEEEQRVAIRFLPLLLLLLFFFSRVFFLPQLTADDRFGGTTHSRRSAYRSVSGPVRTAQYGALPLSKANLGPKFIQPENIYQMQRTKFDSSHGVYEQQSS